MPINYTAIAVGAAVNAATVNNPLTQLDNAIGKNNFVATAAPGVGDDSDDGYTVGSRWLDTTNDRSYVLIDATVGAAVWQLTSVPNTALVTDSNPRTIVGYSANINVTGVNTRIQTFSGESSAGVAGLSIGRFSADSGAGVLLFGKSRNAAIGSFTIVNASDTLGEIKFAGDNGTNLNSVAAVIRAIVDGTPGASDMPGRLEFLTTPDGSVTPAIVLTLKNDGTVLALNSRSYLSGTYDRAASDIAVTNTTTETTIYTKSITGGDLNTVGGLRLRLFCTVANASGNNRTITLRIKFGSTTIVSPVITVATGYAAGLLRIEVDLLNVSASSQRISTVAVLEETTLGNDASEYGTAAEDTSSAKTFAVTAEWSNNDCTLTRRMGTLTIIQ